MVILSWIDLAARAARRVKVSIFYDYKPMSFKIRHQHRCSPFNADDNGLNLYNTV